MTRKSRLEMHKYTIIAGGIKSSDNSAVWTYKSTWVIATQVRGREVLKCMEGQTSQTGHTGPTNSDIIAMLGKIHLNRSDMDDKFNKNGLAGKESRQFWQGS